MFGAPPTGNLGCHFEFLILGIPRCVFHFFFWRRKDAAQALRADLERLAKLRRKMYLV